MEFIHKILLFCLGFCDIYCAIPKRPWQFSNDMLQQFPTSQNLPTAFTQTQAQDPFANQFHETAQITDHCLINSESVHSVINLATMVYVIFHIYKAYKEIYISQAHIGESNDSSLAQTVKGIILYVCPHFLISFGKHSKFLINSLAITLTALIYKTIMRLILLSLQGDILDFIGIIIARLLKTIKTIVIC